MSSFLDCIQKKAEETLSDRQVKELERRYTDLVNRYTQDLGSDEAAHVAAQKVVEIETSKLSKKKRNQMRHAQRTKEILEEIEKGGHAPDAYARDLYESTYIRQQQVEKNITSYLDGYGEQFNENLFNSSRNLESVEAMVREVMGEKTGDPIAAQLADAVANTFEYAHTRFENAGGIQGKLPNYFPVAHKRDAIKAVNFGEWAGEMKKRIDIDKMVSPETGLPIDAKSIDQVLEMHYDLIVNGPQDEMISRIEKGNAKVGGAKRKEADIRRDLSRFYKWKTPSDFLAYNERFGTGREGLYMAVPGYIRSVSRDIALMEKISPNPQAMAQNLDALMLQKKVGNTTRKWTNAMYHVLSGATDGSVAADFSWKNPLSWWYPVIAGTQNWIRSSVLGAASLSAMADSGFVVATARLNNLSGSRMLAKYAGQLKPEFALDRRIARRNGYLVDLIAGSALADTRFAGETMGPGKITQWFAGLTNKFSGLGHMTRANADAVALEAEATFGELVKEGVTWEKLDAPFRDTLEAHGFTPDDWKVISSAMPLEHPENGSVFMRSRDILESANIDKADVDALTKHVEDRSDKIIGESTNRLRLAEEATNILDEWRKVDVWVKKGRPEGDVPFSQSNEKKAIKELKAQLEPHLRELGIKSKKRHAVMHELEQLQIKDGLTLKSAQDDLEGAAAFATREVSRDAYKKNQAVADKLDDWIYTMRQMSTNEPSLRSKAITTGAFLVSDPADVKKGTMIRALSSSLFMFKSFGITNLFTHVMPAAKNVWEFRKTGDVNKLEHAAMVTLTTTLMGALALQAKDLSKGRETRDMNTAAFWKAAAMQGGGFGLFGDFMFSGTSRFGRDPMIEAMGPVAGLANDFYKVAKGQYDQAVDMTLEGKPTKDVNLLRDLFKLAKRNVPVANLWYSRLMVERLFMDQIETMLDPKARQKWARSENQFYKDTGQRLYWRRGEVLPQALK